VAGGVGLVEALAVLKQADHVVLAHDPVDAGQRDQVEDEAECEQVQEQRLHAARQEGGALAHGSGGAWCSDTGDWQARAPRT